MNPICVELSLNLKPSYVPKSLTSLLLDLSRIDDEHYKLSVLSDYICKHEQELTRIDALKHQLPQCRLLLMEAIETLKEEFSNIKNKLQTKTKNNEKKEEMEIHEITCSRTTEEGYAKKQKTSILDNNFQESTWNSIGSTSSGKEKEVASSDESLRNYNHQGFMYPNNYDDPKPLTQTIWKNNRRCWSSELHSRFLEVLNMLGGIEVATPKQVRDFMKVEGLTIDQVKSHLQKYRLHCGKVGLQCADLPPK